MITSFTTRPVYLKEQNTIVLDSFFERTLILGNPKLSWKFHTTSVTLYLKPYYRKFTVHGLESDLDISIIRLMQLSSWEVKQSRHGVFFLSKTLYLLKGPVVIIGTPLNKVKLVPRNTANGPVPAVPNPHV